jgi:FkbM family methyltransferase
VSNVTTIGKAVHEVAGKQVYFPDQDFARFSSFGSYGIDPNAKTGRAVQTVTIDSLGIEEPISFMKVDVQGCDLFALRGARETILRNKMPIVFEYEEQFQPEFKTTFQDYVDFVLSIDYRFVKTIDSINFLIAAG